MPAIDITLPRGEIPAADEKTLPTSAAAFAENVYLEHGRIQPYFDLTAVAASLRAGVVHSLHKYENEHWFSWNDLVHAVKSPIAQDAYRRVYYTDAAGAKVTSNLIATGSNPMPAASYDLGVPAPTISISGTVNDSGADPADYSDDETRYYVMTYVTEYGEEGPQGPASAAIETKHPNDTATLTLPVPTQNTQNITHKKIYRTAVGTTDEFLFVAKIPLATTTFIDDVTGDSLGGVIDTSTFVAPPERAQGIVVLANGSTAVFKGNEVCVSEPYLPYAYPFGYRHSVEYDIVALAPSRYGVVVVTEGKPYILSGGHPSAMGVEELDEMQACVSARSIVDMGSFILYASPDGLVAVTESSARLITKSIIKKKNWEQFQPKTIHAYRYEDKYFAFYGDSNGDGTGVGGFVFDPEDGSIVRLSTYATAGYADIESDTLYLVISGQLNSWNTANTPLTMTWRSKVFDIPEIPFNCMRVDSPDPTKLGLKFWVDGIEVLSVASLPVNVFKLPKLQGRAIQFEVTGTGHVPRMTIATSMSEL